MGIRRPKEQCEKISRGKSAYHETARRGIGRITRYFGVPSIEILQMDEVKAELAKPINPPVKAEELPKPAGAIPDRQLVFPELPPYGTNAWYERMEEQRILAHAAAMDTLRHRIANDDLGALIKAFTQPNKPTSEGLNYMGVFGLQTDYFDPGYE